MRFAIAKSYWPAPKAGLGARARRARARRPPNAARTGLRRPLMRRANGQTRTRKHWRSPRLRWRLCCLSRSVRSVIFRISCGAFGDFPESRSAALPRGEEERDRQRLHEPVEALVRGPRRRARGLRLEVPHVRPHARVRPPREPRPQLHLEAAEQRLRRPPRRPVGAAGVVAAEGGHRRPRGGGKGVLPRRPHMFRVPRDDEEDQLLVPRPGLGDARELRRRRHLPEAVVRLLRGGAVAQRAEDVDAAPPGRRVEHLVLGVEAQRLQHPFVLRGERDGEPVPRDEVDVERADHAADLSAHSHLLDRRDGGHEGAGKEEPPLREDVRPRHRRLGGVDERRARLLWTGYGALDERDRRVRPAVAGLRAGRPVDEHAREHVPPGVGERGERDLPLPRVAVVVIRRVADPHGRSAPVGDGAGDPHHHAPTDGARQPVVRPALVAGEADERPVALRDVERRALPPRALHRGEGVVEEVRIPHPLPPRRRGGADPRRRRGANHAPRRAASAPPR
eukprot:gene11538-biopygen3417